MYSIQDLCPLVQKKQKAMGHTDKWWGFIPAAAGGLYKFSPYLQVQPIHTSFWEGLAKAVVTAIICGFAGGIGKHLYDVIKTKYFK